MPINPADRLLSDDDLIRLFYDPLQIPERSAPAFMYDEGVEQHDTDFLRGELHLYITTVQEQGLAGIDSDLIILAHARKLGCTLVVRDKALIRHHQKLTDLGLNHAGILYAPRRRSPQDIVDWIQTAYERAIELDAPDLLYFTLWRM